MLDNQFPKKLKFVEFSQNVYYAFQERYNYNSHVLQTK